MSYVSTYTEICGKHYICTECKERVTVTYKEKLPVWIGYRSVYGLCQTCYEKAIPLAQREASYKMDSYLKALDALSGKTWVEVHKLVSKQSKRLSREITLTEIEAITKEPIDTLLQGSKPVSAILRKYGKLLKKELTKRVLNAPVIGEALEQYHGQALPLLDGIAAILQSAEAPLYRYEKTNRQETVFSGTGFDSRIPLEETPSICYYFVREIKMPNVKKEYSFALEQFEISVPGQFVNLCLSNILKR